MSPATMRPVGLLLLAVGCGRAAPNDSGEADLPPSTVHSCTWAGQSFCHEWNDRSSTVGANVADDRASCLEDNSIYFGGYPPGVFSATGCDRATVAGQPIAGRCVLPEEGYSDDGTARAGQASTLIRYYYNEYGGTDFTTEPTALIGVKTRCQIAEEGVWQVPPFVDFDWTTVPTVTSLDVACTTDGADSAWDVTVTTTGLDETGGTGGIEFSGSHGNEQHVLVSQGSTMSLHVTTTTTDPTKYACDDRAEMAWIIWITRDGGGHAAACAVGAGDAGDPTPLDPDGRCARFDP